MNGSKPNRPAGIGTTTSRGHSRCSVHRSLSPHPGPLPWYQFSVVAVLTDGARRSRRFSVARTNGHYGKATSQEIAIVKRPEGRAHSQVLVRALNIYLPWGKSEPFSPRRTIQTLRLSLRGAPCSLSLSVRGNGAKDPLVYQTISGTVELDESSGEAGGFTKPQ